MEEASKFLEKLGPNLLHEVRTLRPLKSSSADRRVGGGHDAIYGEIWVPSRLNDATSEKIGRRSR